MFILLFPGRDPGEAAANEDTHHAGHEAAPAWHGPVMNGPLVILATVTLVLGWAEHLV